MLVARSGAGRNGEVAGCSNPNIPRRNIKIKSGKEDVMENDIVKGGCGHSEKELIKSAYIVTACILAGAIFTIIALIA